MPEYSAENPLLFAGCEVTTDGTTASLTGPREEVLELLSYGSCWANAWKDKARADNVPEGAEVWFQRWKNLSKLFRKIAA